MKAVKWLDQHFEEFLLCVLLLIMFLVTMLQITMRTFSNSLPWAEELTRYCLIYSGFLSLGYTVQNNSILKVDILTGMFPTFLQKILEVVLLLVTGLIFGYLFYESIDLVQKIKATNQISSALRLPMYMLYTATLSGFFLGTLRCVQGLFLKVTGFFPSKQVELDGTTGGNSL